MKNNKMPFVHTNPTLIEILSAVLAPAICKHNLGYNFLSRPEPEIVMFTKLTDGKNMSSRLEINFKRLLQRCETIAKDHSSWDWRLEKVQYAGVQSVHSVTCSTGFFHSVQNF